MNVKLLRKVAARIKKHAARFNLRVWADPVSRRNPIDGMLKMPVCKTQACLAGETVLAAGAGFIPKRGGISLRKNYRHRSIPDLAGELLGLTNIYQQNVLFKFKEWSMNQGGWPMEFQRLYEQAKTPKQRAEVAIARIEHFIKTKGKE